MFYTFCFLTCHILLLPASECFYGLAASPRIGVNKLTHELILACHLCLYDLQTKNGFHIFKYKSKIEKKKNKRNINLLVRTVAQCLLLAQTAWMEYLVLGTWWKLFLTPVFLGFNQEVDDTKPAVLAAAQLLW